MADIINFPEKKNSTDYNQSADENYFYVDINGEREYLHKHLDELWNDLYTGKVIMDAWADDDGNICFITEPPKNTPDDLSTLKEHVSFFVQYLNKNWQEIPKFLDDYNAHFSNGVYKKLIYVPAKENS